MKHSARIPALLLALLLGGCSAGHPAETQGTQETPGGEIADLTAMEAAALFSAQDYDAGYDEQTDSKITLLGDRAECSSEAVRISGSTVTILGEGTYLLSGALDDGRVVVQAARTDKVQLVLDGASICSADSAALYVAQADKVFVTLAPDTQNRLANGGSFAAADGSIDAAVFARDDLTFNGTGTLCVDSPAGHGIVSKDDLVITGGTYSVTAAGQGLGGKESIRIADGSFDITAGKDGLHAEDATEPALGFLYLGKGSYSITAAGDGVSASGMLQIDGGAFTLRTGGGSGSVVRDPAGSGRRTWPGEKAAPVQTSAAESAEETASAKGLKAGGNLLVRQGSFDIDAADDAVHSNAGLMISGGSWTIATGDDGLHADETLTMTDGEITITKSYEGVEGRRIFLSGGSLSLVADDDGLNAAGGTDGSGNVGVGGFARDEFRATEDCGITISGGLLHINAAGDGIDSNGDLQVSGGEIYVAGPTSDGDGPLDYNGTATITGGRFLAAGSAGMAQNFGEDSTQGAMLLSLVGAAGDAIVLEDESGRELLRAVAEKDFACVLLSCPEISQGACYRVTAGDSTQEVTMEGLIYGAGGGPGGMGKPGGRPGGMGGPGGPGAPGEKPVDRRTPPEDGDSASLGG